MPIYQYNCQSCGHQLEALQKITEDPLIDCPECGASALKKGVTAAAFRLKGTGWYETDFKNKQAKNAKPGEDKKTKTESGGDKAGDAKSSGGDKDQGSKQKTTSGTAASDA